MGGAEAVPPLAAARRAVQIVMEGHVGDTSSAGHREPAAPRGPALTAGADRRSGPLPSPRAPRASRAPGRTSPAPRRPLDPGVDRAERGAGGRGEQLGAVLAGSGDGLLGVLDL